MDLDRMAETNHYDEVFANTGGRNSKFRRKVETAEVRA